MQAIITELWIYPIKGCSGTQLKSAHALSTGLMHDRCMLVVDAETGRFITQRSHPKMALITPSIAGDTLTLSMAGQAPVSLSMAAGNAAKTVTVWRDTLPAIDMGDAAAAWFSVALNANLRLVRFDPAQRRVVHSQPAHSHQFADGYPFLVLSKASLAALNERLIEKGEAAIGADRFRANIILDDVDAHTEDYAAHFTHASGAEIKMASACTRCQVPTIDQRTGLANPQQEPTMTLNAYRYDKGQDGVVFGMNAVVTQACELREGDTLVVHLAF